MSVSEKAPETAGRTIRSWARWYDLVDLLSFGGTKRIRRSAIRAAAPQPGEAVLDAGCGTGSLLLMLEEKVGPEGRVEGIDASPEMVEEAGKKLAKKGSRAKAQVALMEEIPFGNGEFDLVTSTYVFHHLPDDLKRKGLAEIRRVLKPGGRFLLVDFEGGGHSPIGWLLSLFGHSHDHGHLQELTQMMEGAGFSDVRRLKSKKHRTMAFIRAVV